MSDSVLIQVSGWLYACCPVLHIQSVPKYMRFDRPIQTMSLRPKFSQNGWQQSTSNNLNLLLQALKHNNHVKLAQVMDHADCEDGNIDAGLTCVAVITQRRW